MKKLVLVGALSVIALSCSRNDEEVKHHTDHSHWDYENPDWGKQGYSECAGLVQSPIDIKTANTKKTNLPDINLSYNSFPVKIIDNGHTVQVNTENSSITYEGETYDLKQFHYHTNSEHYVDGKAYPMEVHFVHQNAKTGALIVLGVFVKGEGNENAEFAKYLKAFPTEKNKEITLTENIDATKMFPSSKKYYNYTGSLTTPPCSQGLNWVVFKDAISISNEQLAGFQKKYSKNARPVQNQGSRIVLESN